MSFRDQFIKVTIKLWGERKQEIYLRPDEIDKISARDGITKVHLKQNGTGTIKDPVTENYFPEGLIIIYDVVESPEEIFKQNHIDIFNKKIDELIK